MIMPSSGFLNVGYQHKLAVIKSGETVEILLLDFVDSKGKRFDGLTNQPQRFSINAYTPEGKECAAEFRIQ